MSTDHTNSFWKVSLGAPLTGVMLCLVLMLWGCDQGGSAAAPKPGADWPSNAADAYQGILQPLDGRRIATLAERAQREGVANIDAELDELQPTIRQLITASWIESCDWSERIEGTGFGMAFPYLSLVRSGMELLALDARRHLSDDDTIAAADRLAALVRLARHASDEEHLLPVLVGMAVLDLALQGVTDESASDADWTANAAAMLLDELKDLNPSDPMGAAGAIDTEFEFIDRALAGTQAIPIGIDDDLDAARRRIARLSREELEAERERLRTLRSAVAGINWSGQGAPAQAQRAIDRAQLRIVDGLIPSMDLIPNMVGRTSKTLSEAITRLESAL